MWRLTASFGLLALAAFGLWRLALQPARLPAVTLSAGAAESAQDKANAFARAEAEAAASGRPVPVAETFSDAELSWLAASAARARGLPLQGIVLHATGQGTVEGQATADLDGQSYPLYMEGIPQASGNRIRLRVTASRLGGLPLPGPIADQLGEQVPQGLALGEPVPGFRDLSVTTTEGRLTLSGVATGADP